MATTGVIKMKNQLTVLEKLSTITFFTLLIFGSIILSIMGLNIVGYELFQIKPMSMELIVTLAFAFTYCIKQDENKTHNPERMG